MRVRSVCGVFCLFCALLGQNSAYAAQQDLRIAVDLRLFQYCPLYADTNDHTGLDITIRNTNVPSDLARTITLTCQFDPRQSYDAVPLPKGGEKLALNSGSRGLALRVAPQVLLFVSTNWEGGGQVESDYERLYLSGLILAPQSYRLVATFSFYKEPNEEMLNKDFTVNSESGVSITEFYVRRQGPFSALWSKYANRQVGLAGIIVALTGILLGVLRKRIEATLEFILDGLGKYGIGKLASRRFRKLYLDHVLLSHRYLRLVGLNTAGISRPLLEEVFISLRVSSHDRARTGSMITATENQAAGIAFGTALRQFGRLAVLGGPGAGKTTTLSYAALQFAQQRGWQTFGIRGKMLPLYIPLRRLSPKNTSILEDLTNPETQILPTDLGSQCPPKFFHSEMERGRCLVLLDGLDEVTDEVHHQAVAEKINRLVSMYPSNRFAVTCRISGWRDLLNDFRVLEAEDLSRNEIQRFVVGWHRAVITQAERSRLEFQFPDKGRFEVAWAQHRTTTVQTAIDVQSRILVNAINSSERLLALASNPMLLSLICLVHLNRNVLPRERPLLYDQCVELLIDAWERTKDLTSPLQISGSQKEAVVRQIAFNFQSLGKGEATRERLEEMATSISGNLGLQVTGRTLVEDIERRSGLLVERSIDILGFSHLTLQEYLAAKHIQLNPQHLALISGSFTGFPGRSHVRQSRTGPGPAKN